MSVRKIMPDLSYMTIDSGRYQLLHPLGAGSFGVVYRARERLPNSYRVVDRAIKVTPLTNSKSHLRAQHREADLHQRVSQHPNVVTLRRIVQDACFMYYIMDYCAGGDLFHAIRKKDVFPRNDALVKHLFLQIIDGVESCHKKGVYHRDLKPENILLSSDCTRAYIADFGLASESTCSLSFDTGSRYYMSPECVTRRSRNRRNARSHTFYEEARYPYDTRRSDVWALGMILFSLVTGRLPWLEATVDDPAFLAFLTDATFCESFPISGSLNKLFREVFTARPQDSIGITGVRKAVREMGTFW
ncbi:kinase-like domain-containing protein, partial [Daedaleopsis nitida]